MIAARLTTLIVGLISVVGAPAQAQDYPSRPVTVVVPTGPGGGMEMVARLLAPRLEQRFGKPFVIENRPGAGTNIGAAAVARSAPDGHTLLMATSSTMAINATIYKTLPFDPQKDLVPVVLYARVPFVLVVNPSSPARTAADLVKLAKEKPGTLSFGSSGTGTASHLFAELFKMQTGVDVAHVPYKSMAQPLNDILGGHLHYMFSDLSPALPLVREGKLRALGVTSATRVATADEIPDARRGRCAGLRGRGLADGRHARGNAARRSRKAAWRDESDPRSARGPRHHCALRHDPAGQRGAGGTVPLCRHRDGSLGRHRAQGRRCRDRIASTRVDEMTSPVRTPPFRADQVGSLLRP